MSIFWATKCENLENIPFSGTYEKWLRHFWLKWLQMRVRTSPILIISKEKPEETRPDFEKIDLLDRFYLKIHN